VKSELDKAVADKRITKADEQRELSEVHSRIGDIVNRKPGDRLPLRPGGQRLRRGPHW
jgi:hypothetical protein